MTSKSRNFIWITPEARTSFLNVYEARPNQLRHNALYYDCTLLFSKSTNMRDLIEKVKDLSSKVLNTPIPPRSIFPGDERSGNNDKSVFKDGDAMAAQKETYAAYKGHWVLSLSSPQKDRILIQDEDRQEVMDQADFQSGDFCYAAVEVSIYRSPQFGPQLSLKPKVIRKTRTGDHFGGGISASAAADAMDAATDGTSSGGQSNGGGALL